MLPKDWIDHLDNLPQVPRLPRTSLNQSDLELEKIWNCAFPNGLNHEQVLQLIYRMYEIDGNEYPMSLRAVAHHVGVLIGVTYIELLNEVYGWNDVDPDADFQNYLKERLETCGYYEWLVGDDD